MCESTGKVRALARDARLEETFGRCPAFSDVPGMPYGGDLP
jgi:hypothetical protein